ncbi:interferon-induced helicase C domain-containing protein 1 isoform X1 [Scleropages formosus]|uniref:RNA helicase n=1 Tax=Scleropages formosus TaxID=113540 RepID=A0A8C9SE79_SCLFO|nr:interferon-induced helicase C domain-containing protein 1 isoform X1 [Scleropages formosus]
METQTATDDDSLLQLIECFRNRLRSLIQVEPVLDHLYFIGRDQKELIAATAKNEGNRRAVDLLVDAVGRSSRPAGWSRAFVDALKAGGCKHAAMYVEAEHIPSASAEAENDLCVQLIDLLAPSLQEMKTPEVCLVCYALNILTGEDKEIITAEIANYGNKSGARVLLRRIVQKPPGWFSTFLDALRKTEHFHMVQELMGADSLENNQVPEENNKAGILKHEVTFTENHNKLDSMSEVVKGDTGLPEDNTSQADEAGELDSYLRTGEDTLNASVESTSWMSSMNGSIDTSSLNTDFDLYNTDESVCGTEMAQNVDESNAQVPLPGVDEAEHGATAAGSMETDIVLRPYQVDVARSALEGKNIIICLPTGSGKTRVAVYITKEHLDRCRREGKPGKVVVLVNKVPLVEQHYSTEFGKYLKCRYRVERVSGNSQLKISFSDVVRKNDIIICTAQILENSLARAKSGEDEGVCLSEFSLVVIDECHHTQKGGVYNHIMFRYLKQKHKNARRIKEQNDPIPIPQILGLTASPGVGGANNQKKAEEHILKICANLDAFGIMTGCLGEHKKDPYKKIASAEERKEDPFGDVIKRIMNAIHVHAGLDPLCNPGTQNYEQWVVQKEQNAAKEENQKVRVCAQHLRQYNEALHQSNTIRMSDAFRFLKKYYNEEKRKKAAPEEEEEEEAIGVTETERFLFQLFKDNKAELQRLAEHPEYENKTLSTLRSVILQEFTGRDEARGIIFTRTRLSAIALSQWIQENKKFEEAGVRGSHLIGAGDQSVVKPMTSNEQKEVLRKFRTGEINLLIATTVAEEGLDIKECNIVIRYGLVTNEIAMIQARGRGRAEDSSYTLVELEGSGVAERESVNEYREKMMSKAIQKVQNLERAEYEKKIKEFQFQTIFEEEIRNKKKKQKVMQKEDPGKVKFSCRRCNTQVCSGNDIQIMADNHHVNVSEEFKKLFIVRQNTTLQERSLDYEANDVIACKKCGNKWGNMMRHRGIDCPCLSVKNFVVTIDTKKKTYNKWNELAIRFPVFDYSDHAHLLANSDSD